MENRNISNFGWQARLNVVLGMRDGRCVPVRRSHSGPLVVQKPFYPEGPGLCQMIVLHPPGGLVGGDELDLSIRVESGAQGLVTTPAAGKFYRGEGRTARQTAHFKVHEGATLEWLPHETILYDGALAELGVQVDVDTGGLFAAWEIVCLGRPAAGERFERGQLAQRMEVWTNGTPLVIERAHYDGGSRILSAPWGWRGFPVAATLIANPQDGSAALDAMRVAAGDPLDGEYYGCTVVNGVVIARYLGSHAERARAVLISMWAALRPGLNGREASPPRIWKT